MTSNICVALSPNEILVVSNKNASRSVGLAKYYMKKRGIPEENLLKLWVTDREITSRTEYEKKVAAPVRRYLAQSDFRSRIRCLVIMYGLPLKVAPSKLTVKEKAEIDNLQKEQRKLLNELEGITEKKGEEKQRIKKKVENTKKRIFNLESENEWSSLDSEIALVLEKDYPFSGWVPNPLFLGFKDKDLSVKRDNVLMVSRLDGSSDSIVKRIIDDSLKAEEAGLSGIAYFDARWPKPEKKKKVSGYGFYDQSIHLAAKRVKESMVMPVKVESTQALFQPGDGLDAALYCGWYKLAHYVDAFTWKPGAIGYHIASGECSTLKRKNSQVWCKRMLEEGVAATIGPVREPYVQAFPVPEIFFGFLVDGYLSLVECYFVSTPYLSWQMVLIGDPLYRPFKKRGKKTEG